MDNHKHHQQPKPNKHWLRHPALWIPVLLMLLGIAIYVMTLDESLQPDGKTQPAVPAAP